MFADDNRCNKCGGFKQERGAPSGSGRITQWVFACTCSMVEAAESKGETTTTVICRLCGKCIQQGRVGSFTQWVFRSDLCGCETPDPVAAEVAVAAQTADAPLKLIDEEQAQLDVPSDKFPLDRYKPLSIIGSGASGVVYHCIDRILNKRVAIKSLHVIDQSQLVAFQREAITTSNLNHDNVVKILDFGATEGGSPYMVMDFVEGVDLKTLIEQNGVLTPWQAVYVAQKVALGLAHAHSQGIFHRDIKCSNILVMQGSKTPNTENPDEQLEPVIIDFGVAQFKAGVKNQNADKTGIVGSPLYMAPDQAMGHEYDARSEIYSLGCCLFESLTGTVPFQGNTALETMSMHAHQEPSMLADALLDSSLDSSLESRFTDDLENLVAGCLAKDPDSRYQTAQELADALSEILDSGELVPRTETTIADGSRIESPATKSGNVKTKVLVATVGALILAGLSALTLNRTLNQQPQIVEKQFEVAGLDDFGRVTESTLLGAKKGPLKNTVNWEVLTEADDQQKKRKPTGGTFRQFAPPPPLGDGVHVWTLGEGEVTDSDFAKLKGKKVEYLIVHSEFVNGSGLKFLNGTGVRSVDLGHCQVDENGLRELAKLPNVSSINLEFNPVTDDGVKLIANMPLTLLQVKRTRITDKSLVTIRNFHELVTLNITGTAITEGGIMSLKDMPSLKILDLSKMRFHNNLKGIENFNIVTLNLSDTNVDDRTIAQIVRVSSLNFLTLDKTKVTDFMFGLLPRLKQLRRISVRQCEAISQEAVDRFRRKNPHIQVDSD